jgi:hypothetical protein
MAMERRFPVIHLAPTISNFISMVKSGAYIPILRLMPGVQRCPPTGDLRVRVMDISFLGHFFSPLFFITWRSFQDNLVFNYRSGIPFACRGKTGLSIQNKKWASPFWIPSPGFSILFRMASAKICVPSHLEAGSVIRDKKKVANAPVRAAMRKDQVKVPVRSAMYPPKEGDRMSPSP